MVLRLKEKVSQAGVKRSISLFNSEFGKLFSYHKLLHFFSLSVFQHYCMILDDAHPGLWHSA